jgi:hypothetical protein
MILSTFWVERQLHIYGLQICISSLDFPSSAHLRFHLFDHTSSTSTHYFP